MQINPYKSQFKLRTNYVHINKPGDNCALLRNNPEERSSHLLRGGSLKSPNIRGVRKKWWGWRANIYKMIKTVKKIYHETEE